MKVQKFRKAKAGTATEKRRVRIRRPVTLDAVKGIYLRRLNDIHVATQTTLASLERSREENAALAEERASVHFSVPSSGQKETARIQRRARDMKAIFDQLIDHGERGKSLLLAVSVTEDFVVNMLKLVLRAHPDRMNRGLKGGEAETSIRLEEFLTRTRDEIVEERIRSRLHRALYSSPADYLKYVGDVMEFQLDEPVTSAFIEAKATRDIVVHANGIANEIYEAKAGAFKRAAAGERLSIDAEYFDSCIRTMKTLVVKLHAGVTEKHAADERVQAEAGRFMR